MVSFTNSEVKGILMRRNMRFSTAIVIERLTDKNRRRINAAHVKLSKLSQGNSKNFHPQVYRGFTWEIHLRYNNKVYHISWTCDHVAQIRFQQIQKSIYDDLTLIPRKVLTSVYLKSSGTRTFDVALDEWTKIFANFFR